MGRPWIKAFVIVFIALMIAGTAFYFKRGAAEKEAVSFRPVYFFLLKASPFRAGMQ